MAIVNSLPDEGDYVNFSKEDLLTMAKDRGAILSPTLRRDAIITLLKSLPEPDAENEEEASSSPNTAAAIDDTAKRLANIDSDEKMT
jgi:hypothetical protein